ncbi:sterile alpha motif domain-containing protein 3-like isoform X1 [Hoplias malabaricus]|uniref:sterile alpha motif domain-containing protein 3-like isoform X1 n=1 Tax=Hoplias malabaricus TaxID=27720 RepID=UPI003462E9BB
MISYLFEGSFKKQAKFHSFVKESKEIVTLTIEPVSLESHLQSSVGPRPSATFPAIFVVPKFPRFVQTKLYKKDAWNIVSSDRHKIIRTLYESMAQYSMYPSTNEYVQVCKALILKYPFLKDKEGNGYHTWHMSLKRKFKFERVPLVDDEEVKIIKQRFGHSKKPHQPEASNCKRTERPMDINAIGEDETSIDRHVKVLQDQYRRTQPDAHIVEEQMRRTFVWRRNEIAGGITVKDAVNKYPFLRSPHGLHQEMGRLHKAMNVCRRFQVGFDHIVSSLLRLAEGKSPLAKLHKEAREDALTEDLPGIDFRAALLMLPSLFREKLDSYIMLGEGEPSSPYPTVQVPDDTEWTSVFTRRVTAVVKVDGLEVCRASGVEEGALSAFCAYYVFNMAYPSHLKNTLAFIQKYVLKISEKGDKPLPTTVTRLINLLE